jgi:hypothetical protein
VVTLAYLLCLPLLMSWVKSWDVVYDVVV